MIKFLAIIFFLLLYNSSYTNCYDISENPLGKEKYIAICKEASNFLFSDKKTKKTFCDFDTVYFVVNDKYFDNPHLYETLNIANGKKLILCYQKHIFSNNTLYWIKVEELSIIENNEFQFSAKSYNSVNSSDKKDVFDIKLNCKYKNDEVKILTSYISKR